MEPVTIRDIARMCGVGVSTVSRAINNHPDINQETRDMIMDTIRKYHYIPNNSARNLKRAEANTIAVLIKGITNPLFSKMIEILEEEIQKKKYSFILHRVDDREDEVDVALELVKEKRLKGIVFLGGFFNHSREKLRQLTVPFVISTVGIPEDERMICSSVSVDDFAESRKLVNYLCQQGHKRILILASREDDESIGKLRLEGYKQALADHGIPFDPKLCVYMDQHISSYSMENSYCCMKRVLAEQVDMTAVFAIADTMAIGACRALFEAGKRIPEDVSVAGFDGLDIAHYYNPSITTIRQPVTEMAYATSELLFGVIHDKAEHQRRVFPAELIVGESTGVVNNVGGLCTPTGRREASDVKM